jgi:hypothetical protein
MRSATDSLTAPAVEAQDESARRVGTVARRRTINPLAGLCYYFAFVFAAGGAGVALGLGTFIDAVEGASPHGPALLAGQIACVIAGLVVSGVAFAMGRALENPKNLPKVITVMTAVGLPLMLLAWAWVLTAGF